MRSKLWTASIVLAALSVACGGARIAPPIPVTVDLAASAELNQDESGQPLPTVVRLYLLRSSARLEQAECETVYGEPRESFGEDVLRVDEVQLAPGRQVRRVLEWDPAARALAVVAVFRKPEGLGWRAILPLPPPKGRAKFKPVAFWLEDYRVRQR